MIQTDRLLNGFFLKRYKRFFADIKLENGQIICAYCPNTGSLKSCLAENARVLVDFNPSPKRKLDYTLEFIHSGSCWIGINPQRANNIVHDALKQNIIPDLSVYESIQREVSFLNSRFDFLLSNQNINHYIEVKSVTLVNESFYEFPDAITKRGQKHISDLIKVVEQGQKASMFYLIQRSDAKIFRPAHEIDPDYANLLKKAVASGVTVYCYDTLISPPDIQVGSLVNVDLSYV
ncbi:DNA/RNA nuclease SfsA [Candidatus Marinamargulisbacteria bacterium SCGC AG-410-N11]|nr:DNA/RNA nuclease SfsA [Candidatus Marinamargulisbacteria bacterium SCGC AG-410-N11]